MNLNHRGHRGQRQKSGKKESFYWIKEPEMAASNVPEALMQTLYFQSL
jgi:hypothetical protein